MEFTPVQSPDVPINNPLQTNDLRLKHQPMAVDWKKITANPKILLLSILSLLVSLLAIAAIIKVTIQNPNTNTIIPTPIIAKPTATIQLQDLIPTSLKNSFNQIDQTLGQVNPPPPPQVDEKISP